MDVGDLGVGQRVEVAAGDFGHQRERTVADGGAGAQQRAELVLVVGEGDGEVGSEGARLDLLAMQRWTVALGAVGLDDVARVREARAEFGQALGAQGFFIDQPDLGVAARDLFLGIGKG